MNTSVVIIGAGLTGLLTAYRLQELGFDVKVLEARERIGGRINTIESGKVKVEMGATWFNEAHYHLLDVIEEFKVPYFEQFMTGISYFQTFSNVPPQEIAVPNDSPSYRFKNGTIDLLNSIAAKLKPNTIFLNEVVNEVNVLDNNAEVISNSRTLYADIVITTLPPAALIDQIEFSPALPNDIISLAEQTHTWMQDSIKVALTYKKPFWRDQGKSGTIFSNVGPLTEFYDQSNVENESYALVGFASGSCARFTKEQRIEKIEAQLKMVFGEEALQYESYLETPWYNEEFTKSNRQEGNLFPHQNGGHALYQAPLFESKLFICGAETSKHHSGYMEGAIFAAESVVAKLKRLHLTQ
ncbi:FAD-dependent oxidoreductase [Maribacter sp. BPC-D8]|uniref:flavin monoamine oxidase family protein n=1 Tax=Maribacter sp. BPC-D8 TaxID=3053613 RepID=UPI002B4908C0|nr:FAD-dependent oxidoreductase [Maribacter sp. BPC-D8]WRI31628.1 FAD-dependent oxidoreductase [Maribacter sp. BPC-D8]